MNEGALARRRLTLRAIRRLMLVAFMEINVFPALALSSFLFPHPEPPGD
jgi:hypothetical protein